jgi:hypothetical protein
MAGLASCESTQPASARRAYIVSRGAAPLIAALALALAGCGGDDEKEKGNSNQSSTPRTTETKGGSTATTKTQTGAGGGTPAGTSPEDQPGGAGDEQPNRAPALFTGRGGRITPRVVRVPPFIAIFVELRSADGRAYALKFGGKTLRTGPQVASMSTSLAGLRHGQSIVGRPVGVGGNAVRIEASAEPGP